jgi:hypothetical protein
VSNEAAPESSAPLQFDQVDLPAGAPTKLCGLCGASIADTYFEAGGRVLCPACGDKVAGNGGGRGAFPRAALFGAGAALLGTIVWLLIMKLADMELGLVAVAVGYAVGRAVHHGSRGRGGWKYQALAMFLSYASICTSYVPYIIKGLATAGDETKAGDKSGDKENKGAASDTKREDATADVPGSAAKAPAEPVTAGGWVLFGAVVFGLAFASPFLAGAENIMGILIIAVALYEAWKLNRKVAVAGPFRMAAAAEAP